jgi:hypothetical protein
MGQHTIEEINNFETFKYDNKTKRIVNQKFKEDTNIDEFLTIQHLLDNCRVRYRFDKNFDIQILS